MSEASLARAAEQGTRFDAFKIDAAPKDYNAALAWAFPVIKPYMQPLGAQIVVQLRRPSKTTASSLIIRADDTKDAEQYNTQIAKVVAIGPGAFLNRVTGEPWPEVTNTGQRVTIGSVIRIPKAGLDRWFQHPEGEKNEDPVMLALIRDTDIKALWTADPLHVDTAKSGW